MVDIVLFGDESGLRILVETLEGRHDICVKAMVFNKSRETACREAERLSLVLGCAILGQPRVSEEKENIEFLSMLKSFSVSVAICCSYDMILSPDILGIFNKGVYNIHGALLPKYRGANVLNWVLVNGENETGVTIHRMAQRVDAGPIVMQLVVAIDYCDTAVTLRNKLISASKRMLVTFWDELVNNTIVETAQNEEEATYVARRKPADGLFEWSWEAERIYNLIRALVKPWPGAYYIQNNEKKVVDYYMTIDEVRNMKIKMEQREQ